PQPVGSGNVQRHHRSGAGSKHADDDESGFRRVEQRRSRQEALHETLAVCTHTRRRRRLPLLAVEAQTTTATEKVMTRFVWLALVFSITCSAKTFQNSYIRWELPETWRCTQEGTAWVCAPINARDAREAVIVAPAKLAGPEDNLNAFANYLRKP